MAIIKDIIQKNFPSIDSDIFTYLQSVLDNGKDDFESMEEVFESVGEILLDVSEGKDEQDIRNICQQFFDHLSR